MKAVNKLYCSNCNAENPLYLLNCRECKSFLRERVVNIDLWTTIYDLLIQPRKAFQHLIFAEHKNYIVFITLIISVKFFFHSLFLNHIFEPDRFAGLTNTEYYFVILISFVSILLLVSTMLYALFHLLKTEVRFKDIYTIIIYSFILETFALLILSTIEYALFGSFWFTFNPSPFVLKHTPALVISGIEAITFLWGVFLLCSGINTVTDKKIISIVAGIVVSMLILSAIFYSPELYLSLFK